MTRQEFWDLLGPPGDEDNRFKRIVKTLAAMPEEESFSFEWNYYAMIRRAERFSLRGAAYLIVGGGSEDGFIDVQQWLVEQGRAIYEAALADPDTLADVLNGEDVEPFGLNHAACRAWAAKRGGGEEAEYERRFEEFRLTHTWEPIEKGEEFDITDHDELRHRFPCLWAMY